MQIFGALLCLSALGFLLWRVQTNAPWVERVPFVLDVAAAVGAAATGSTLIAANPVLAALAAGAVAGGLMAAALMGAYAVAYLCGRLPGMSGVELVLEIPERDAGAAERWFHHRLAQHGFEGISIEGGRVDAIQGTNKMQWDRRVRPKRLAARLEEGGESHVARIRLRYVPPAMGLDRHLRPIAESLASEPTTEATERTAPRVVPPLELIVVIGFLVLFAMVAAAPR